MNPPGTPIKAVWRSTGSAPYTLSLGSPLPKRTEPETIVYSRQLIYARDDEAVLAVRVFAPQITGENEILEFPAVANNDSLVAGSLAEKLTFDFVVPTNAETAKLDVEIYTKGASKLLQSAASALQVGFELIDLSDNRRAVYASMESVDDSTTSRSATLRLANLHGKSVRLRPVLAGLDFDKVRGALVHEYGAYPAGSRQSEPQSAQIASNSHDLSVQVHPNPFNPFTQIQFTLPIAGVVSLRVYDMNGRLVREWSNELYTAGEHTIVWNGNDDSGQPVASGMYFSELVFGTERQVAKMALIR